MTLSPVTNFSESLTLPKVCLIFNTTTDKYASLPNKNIHEMQTHEM